MPRSSKCGKFLGRLPLFERSHASERHPKLLRLLLLLRHFLIRVLESLWLKMILFRIVKDDLLVGLLALEARRIQNMPFRIRSPLLVPSRKWGLLILPRLFEAMS